MPDKSTPMEMKMLDSSATEKPVSDGNSTAGERSLEQRLLLFFRAVMQDVWNGLDPDGGDVQNYAQEFGLTVKTTFDPKKHGACAGADWCEDGDDWFEYASDIPSPAVKPDQRQDSSVADESK